MESGSERYQEFKECVADTDSCLIFMKVVALPYLNPVEFNIAEAKAFAEKLRSAIAEVEKQMEQWDAPKL